MAKSDYEKYLAREREIKISNEPIGVPLYEYEKHLREYAEMTEAYMESVREGKRKEDDIVFFRIADEERPLIEALKQKLDNNDIELKPNTTYPYIARALKEFGESDETITKISGIDSEMLKLQFAEEELENLRKEINIKIKKADALEKWIKEEENRLGFTKEMRIDKWVASVIKRMRNEGMSDDEIKKVSGINPETLEVEFTE